MRFGTPIADVKGSVELITVGLIGALMLLLALPLLSEIGSTNHDKWKTFCQGVNGSSTLVDITKCESGVLVLPMPGH